MSHNKQDKEDYYRNYWSSKTDKQIEREINSWRRYFDKYGSAYAWHGSDITPPNELADGDKISILKEILTKRREICQK